MVNFDKSHHLWAGHKKLTSKHKYAWNNISLPSRQLTQLKEIYKQAKYHLSIGKGLIVLFVGLSGTEKTMAAMILANHLKLGLYHIDPASVVSKYIGETEKNLSRIFQEAEQRNDILFFDEADALFSKRSEVKDSHDRYANLESNHLFQSMEEYKGLVILSSNVKKNIDEAFIRRLHYIVEFPMPDTKRRKRK